MRRQAANPKMSANFSRVNRCFYERARLAPSESMDGIWLPSVFSEMQSFRGQKGTVEARATLEQGLLRPLSSYEVIGGCLEAKEA